MKYFNESDFNLSAVKYLLKVGIRNGKVKEVIIPYIKLMPELIEEFCIYLRKFMSSNDDELSKQIFSQLKENFNRDYVEYQLWTFLSEMNINRRLKKEYISYAIQRIKKTKNSSPILRLGLYNYLCSTHNALILKWLINEKYSLIISFVIKNIEPKIFRTIDFEEFLKNISLNRKHLEIFIVIIKNLMSLNLHNIYKEILSSNQENKHIILSYYGTEIDIDSFSLLFNKAYDKTFRFNGWSDFLKEKENHAYDILRLSFRAINLDGSSWLSHSSII